MLKSLKIDPYIDGYNWGQINCLEIPIAGAAGYYNYDNYYFYSFYYSMSLNWMKINWMDIRSKSISDFRNYSLKKLGLTMKSNRVKDSAELESLIKDSIDNSIPLILIADYTSLFYTNDYLCNNTAEHGIIINGYHTEKSVIVFRETKVVDTNIETEASKHFKGNPLFTMLVRKDLVFDIWNNRNRYYEQKDKEQVNIIYTIEKDSNAEVNSYEDIICDLACYNNFEHDNLIELINNFNNLREKIKDETIPMWFFWRDLHGSLEAFFSVGAKVAPPKLKSTHLPVFSGIP